MLISCATSSCDFRCIITACHDVTLRAPAHNRDVQPTNPAVDETSDGPCLHQRGVACHKLQKQPIISCPAVQSPPIKSSSLPPSGRRPLPRLRAAAISSTIAAAAAAMTPPETFWSVMTPELQANREVDCSSCERPLGRSSPTQTTSYYTIATCRPDQKPRKTFEWSCQFASAAGT